MWNENAPLELLAVKSKDLTEENLSEIQGIIDWDKYINSSIMHMDLCGSYAPFCDGCDKSQKYPCALAYINMKKAEGMDITLQSETAREEEVSVGEQVAEQPIEAENLEAEKVVEDVPVYNVQPKRIGKIRIAIARRKR